MIQVLIADDHAIVRRGLQQILAEHPGIMVAGEVGCAAELGQALRTRSYDVVVLDISMPGRSGLEALQELKQQHPRLPVLILTMYPEEELAVRALRAGAAGYMTKETAPEELVTAIRRLHQGGRYVSAALAERLAAYLAEADQPRHAALSEREFEVLRLIGSGKTVSQIADILALSVKTVSTYRSRLLEKMDMTTNAELTYYAVKHGLVD